VAGGWRRDPVTKRLVSRETGARRHQQHESNNARADQQSFHGIPFTAHSRFGRTGPGPRSAPATAAPHSAPPGAPGHAARCRTE